MRENLGLTVEDSPREADMASCLHLKPLVVTALPVGFRASELLSPAWDDVDFCKRMTTVRAAYTKNGESRSGPMNEVLLATLKTCKMTIPSYGLVFVPTGERHTDHCGQRLNTRYI